MLHEEFLDYLCDRCRNSPETYLDSALATSERSHEQIEGEAVARWMVGRLFYFMADASILAQSHDYFFYAQTDRVFEYWERNRRERVVFRVHFCRDVPHIDVRVATISQGGFLLEIYDFLANRPLDRGTFVGQLKPEGNDRVVIETVIVNSPSRRRGGRRR